MKASLRPGRAASLLLAALFLCPSCFLRQMALNSIGESFSSAVDVFGADDDPELVAQALPFALKTIEALLAEDPESPRLLLAAASGFTTYAYAFVDSEAERVEDLDYGRAVELRERALGLYLRARDYGLRGLELRHPGIGDELRRNPSGAASRLELEDVELAYWTGAAWGGAIGVALDRPEIVADVDAPREILRRLLVLAPDFDDGSVHQAMISIEALPEMMGGSPERARYHFDRAVELGRGQLAGPYVSFATQVSIPAQDRAEFDRLLEQALAVDLDARPSARLANVLAQRRARYLLDHADDYFL